MPNYFLINIISYVFQIINILIIIRVLLSWFNISSYNQYIRLLYTITEPILAPIRNLLSSFNMGIDISPLIALFALSIIRNFLIRLLIQLQFNQTQRKLQPIGVSMRGVHAVRKGDTHCNIFFLLNFLINDVIQIVHQSTLGEVNEENI